MLVILTKVRLLSCITGRSQPSISEWLLNWIIKWGWACGVALFRPWSSQVDSKAPWEANILHSSQADGWRSNCKHPLLKPIDAKCLHSKESAGYVLKLIMSNAPLDVALFTGLRLVGILELQFALFTRPGYACRYAAKSRNTSANFASWLMNLSKSFISPLRSGRLLLSLDSLSFQIYSSWVKYPLDHPYSIATKRESGFAQNISLRLLLFVRKFPLSCLYNLLLQFVVKFSLSIVSKLRKSRWSSVSSSLQCPYSEIRTSQKERICRQLVFLYFHCPVASWLRPCLLNYRRVQTEICIDCHTGWALTRLFQEWLPRYFCWVFSI